MRFTVENLGRLGEATIDLNKDLILLTGPNNTSKTYVAHTIYGFCRRIDSILKDLIKRQGLPDIEAGYRAAIDLPRLLRERLAPMLAPIGEAYTRQLTDVLAADDSFTSRARIRIEVDPGQMERFEHALLHLEMHREFKSEGFWAMLEGGITIEKRAGSPITTITRMPALTGMNEPDARDPKADLAYFSSLVASFISSVLAETVFAGAEDACILPAERSAIQLFSRELSIKRNELVDTMARVAGRPRDEPQLIGEDLEWLLARRARRYPLPIRDGLDLASNLSEVTKLKSDYASLADDLERDVMGGSIEIDENGDTRFQPSDSGTRISMHLSSSSVKALSALSIYLRHLARKGQILIIDEPELNLHPDNQRRIARVLARLVRSGVKVMISTHSDYVIRELNNLIMLSADKSGNLLQKHGYRTDETLLPEQVGAYLFSATSAEPIGVDPTGVEVKTIDREINRLNVASQDIYFSLFNARDT
ncbi:hypothetical protein BE20_25370 [Sorangium cellulosum]|uniref:Endonuclease GajA/Old nuclease/RecF-like AAA domain-containing protein n=1 Tax=Sorangium cellulosum TaxID=56 RepID=A0A150S1Y5_SORCE|nr:hypothetical protein BE18_04705 [Sorangium cellulosum]KYF87647.1 hypothetical protein BE20_25370 [Sorangium cellulosum]